MQTVVLLLALALAPAAWEAEQKEATTDRDYERAMKAIDNRQYEEALRYLATVEAAKGAKADGALYWKAYSEAKLGDLQKAMAALKALEAYKESRWQNDAKALEMELKQRMGQPVAPESAGPDEDLKLMALNSLMQTDPEKSVPVLEKVLNGSASPRLKERALFVLSQSDSAKARQVIAGIAKGSSNPDLQRKALHNLAISGSTENRKLMRSFADT